MCQRLLSWVTLKAPRQSRCASVCSIVTSPRRCQGAIPGVWSYLQTELRRDFRNVTSAQAARFGTSRNAVRRPVSWLPTWDEATGSRSPFRFILNRSRAVVTNVYLNLYPTDDLASCLAQDETREFELLGFLNSMPLAHVVRAGRSYGGGLHKIEPRELAELTLETPPPWLRQAKARQLVLCELARLPTRRPDALA